MFSHRGLFLTVTVSLVGSIALADVLVHQPDSYQYDSNPRYLQHQSVSQHWIQSPTEQYRMEQLPNQESTRYLSGVQPVYPYESNQADARYSHVLSYPHHPPYHHYLPRPHHVHFAKIGGRGYVRPSVYVGHPQSLTVHNRRKRSRRSDPTSTESSKFEVAAHDNDVAAESPLTDTKHPTTIDSLLLQNEPTDTTDKRVENRQIRNYITNPHSFGFYPENTHLKHYTYNIPNTWPSIIYQYDTNRHLQPSNVAQGEACYDDSRIIYNRPLMRFAQSSSSQKFRAAHHQPEKKYLQEIANMNMISTAEPSQDKTLQIPFYSE